MVTLFSYRVVSAVELENIINIIEGVRYGLPPGRNQARPDYGGTNGGKVIWRFPV